jgi:hypothetical protein
MRKSVAKITQEQQKPKPPARKRASRAKPKSKKRMTQAEVLRRHRQIVILKDGGGKSWVSIAQEMDMDEDAVRTAYWDYTREVVPLIQTEQPPEVAVSYMRMLELQRESLLQTADTTTNESVKVGAIRAAVGIIVREVELRQHLGLMPTNMGDLPKIEAMRDVIQVFLGALRKLNAPREVYDEIANEMRGKLAIIDGDSRRVA